MGLDITDMLGRKVYQTTINASAGMNKVQWNPSLGCGMYIVNLHTARGQFKMKVVRGE